MCYCRISFIISYFYKISDCKILGSKAKLKVESKSHQ